MSEPGRFRPSPQPLEPGSERGSRGSARPGVSGSEAAGRCGPNLANLVQNQVPGLDARGHGSRSSGRGDAYESAAWKNVAIAPAEPATTITPQISSSTSTTLPAGVSGLRICDEIVRSCTVVKKSASPNEWMSPPRTPFSVMNTATVPT